MTTTNETGRMPLVINMRENPTHQPPLAPSHCENITAQLLSRVPGVVVVFCCCRPVVVTAHICQDSCDEKSTRRHGQMRTTMMMVMTMMMVLLMLRVFKTQLTL